MWVFSHSKETDFLDCLGKEVREICKSLVFNPRLTDCGWAASTESWETTSLLPWSRQLVYGLGCRMGESEWTRPERKVHTQTSIAAFQAIVGSWKEAIRWYMLVCVRYLKKFLEWDGRSSGIHCSPWHCCETLTIGIPKGGLTFTKIKWSHCSKTNNWKLIYVEARGLLVWC